MDQNSWEPGFSQLVSALLQLHEDRVQHRGLQRGRPLSRLSVMRSLFRLLLPSSKESQSFRSQEQASRLYRQLTNKDMVSAMLEINTIEHQLSLIDDRRALQGAEHLATPQELEMAARALLLYYLQGQTTDDPVFQETQTAFQEVWTAENERTASIMEGAGRERRQQVATTSAKETAALDRYRSYWDRWLFEQLGGQRGEPEGQ
jgi:hypothetical protein